MALGLKNNGLFGLEGYLKNLVADADVCQVAVAAVGAHGQADLGGEPGAVGLALKREAVEAHVHAVHAEAHFGLLHLGRHVFQGDVEGAVARGGKADAAAVGQGAALVRVAIGLHHCFGSRLLPGTPLAYGEMAAGQQQQRGEGKQDLARGEGVCDIRGYLKKFGWIIWV